MFNFKKTSSGDISARLQKMSLIELQTQLAECDNPIKEQVIRKFIRMRYLQEQRRQPVLDRQKQITSNSQKIQVDQRVPVQQHLQSRKQMVARPMVHNIPQPPTIPNYGHDSMAEQMDILDSLIEDNVSVDSMGSKGSLSDLETMSSDSSGSSASSGSSSSSASSSSPENEIDMKMREKLARDNLNNNLTDRMNSDIDIREFNKNRRERQKNKYFSSPFGQGGTDSLASYADTINEIQEKDFSNRRLLKKKSKKRR